MKTEPNDDYQQGFTRVLWSHREMAEGMNVPRAPLYRLVDGGEILKPDVLIAPSSAGWDPERVARFGRDIGRLDSGGQPLQKPSDDWAEQAKQWSRRKKYATTTQVYLSSWLCSYLYGLQKSTVYFIRQRGGFIPADVLIGKNKYGWDETRAIEIGEQTGRLDDQKIDRWVVRRTAEFGLSPRADWVERRVTDRPYLTRPLEEAIEARRAVSRGA